VGVSARVLTVGLAVAVVAFGLGADARASQLVDRNATAVQLTIRSDGVALLSYRKDGRARHVFAWGAMNAREPNPMIPQVRFKFDYTGGWAHTGHQLWRTFRGVCLPYDGPKLAWLVKACKAPDGSYWAVQSWQRSLPHRGHAPWRPGQNAWEVHLSHWTGPLAKLEVHRDWAFGEADDLFGRLTYLGVPVHGFHSSHNGVALDGYGRGLYIDTYNSPYGRGWKRETSILTRRPSGVFCYSFWPTRDPSLPGYPNDLRAAGRGKRYRITVSGPGVTPDLSWEGAALHHYNPNNARDVAYERSMNALLNQLAGSDPFCKTQH
jgi:hypothetical protein